MKNFFIIVGAVFSGVLLIFLVVDLRSDIDDTLFHENAIKNSPAAPKREDTLLPKDTIKNETATPSRTDNQYRRINDEVEFTELFVGKTLIGKDTVLILSANHKVNGQYQNKYVINGDWNWKGRYFCRHILVAENSQGTDCQVVEAKKNAMRITERQGKGASRVYIAK